MNLSHFHSHSRWLPAIVLALALPAASARATDGFLVDPGGTYYEEKLATTDASALSSPSAALPDRLHVSSSAASLQYRQIAADATSSSWEVSVVDFARRHERVDALYDMILVLPLPAGADGGDAFQALDRAVAVWEGSAEKAIPLIYGGEKIVLKRNVALEKTLLPLISATGGEADRLPSLDGTGYRYTIWDTVATRDAGHAATVQGSATLRYATDPGVRAPSVDGRLAAWWITWIPALPAEVEPYAVRIDLDSGS